MLLWPCLISCVHTLQMISLCCIMNYTELVNTLSGQDYKEDVRIYENIVSHMSHPALLGNTPSNTLLGNWGTYSILPHSAQAWILS